MNKRSLGELRDISKDISLLYVEDESDVANEMKIFLDRIFVNYDYASDGLMAFNMYKKRSYNLILTDIVMPNMNGLDLIKKIKVLNPHQQVIIMSGYTDSSHLYDAIKMGINDFVLKPTRVHELAHSLYKVIKKLSLEIENKKYQTQLEELVEKQVSELKYTYETDDLTKLKNRVSLKIDLYKKESKNDILILLNIDNFSNMNEAFGMDFGDEVLAQVAIRLQEYISSNLNLYRLDGDQFVIYGDIEYIGNPLKYCQEINEYFNDLSCKNEAVNEKIQFSFGISDGDSNNKIKESEIALKDARLVGKKGISFYNKNSQYKQQQRELVDKIFKVKEAVDNDLFIPYFQPIVDVNTFNIMKYEALVRMKDGENILSPFMFLSAAKKGGYLSNITHIMVEKCFEIFSKNSLEFSINITSNDLLNESFLIFLDEKIEEFSIEPHRLTLEILEDINIKDNDIILKSLEELSKYGFQIAIDDFGVEGSNFSRLMQINAEFIKIDGIFIKNIVEDKKCEQIVKAIVGFASGIGAKTVAEYVENEAILNKIKELGIDYVQGYHFYKPASKLV
ncbi:MAG: EAL domain-containing protein [Campylobacterota bacterium]|nr:EAL domain-containing protein [Campylobacterota bacterium]